MDWSSLSVKDIKNTEEYKKIPTSYKKSKCNKEQLINILNELYNNNDNSNDKLLSKTNKYPEGIEVKIIYDKTESNTIILKIKEETKDKLTQPIINVCGKEHKIPRYQGGFGDDGLKYSYSKITVNAEPWTPTLAKIRDKVQNITNLKFNFVLVNYYRDGNDYISYHADDEKVMGNNPIVSVSFGIGRDFLLKNNNTKEVTKIFLNSGDLLSMSYEINQKYKHSIPKRANVKDERFNLTFRTLV